MGLLAVCCLLFFVVGFVLCDHDGILDPLPRPALPRGSSRHIEWPSPPWQHTDGTSCGAPLATPGCGIPRGVGARFDSARLHPWVFDRVWFLVRMARGGAVDFLRLGDARMVDLALCCNSMLCPDWCVSGDVAAGDSGTGCFGPHE